LAFALKRRGKRGFHSKREGHFLRRFFYSFGLLGWCTVFADIPRGAPPLRITGSATLFPFAAKVAERFAEKQGGRTPLVEAVGTGGGVMLFCSGIGNQTPDILMASRPLTPQERQLCFRHGVVDVVEIVAGLDGIVLVQSQKSPSLHLSRRDVFEALSDLNKPSPLYWSDLNAFLPSLPIQILGPSPSSGTRDALIDLLLKPFCQFFRAEEGAQCKRLRHDDAYSDVGDNQNVIIQKILVSPISVGIISFSFFKQNQHLLKAVSIDGVIPSQKTLVSGKYPVARPLYLYVKKAHLSPLMRAYLHEFLSQDAVGERGYLTQDGLVTLPREQLKQMRQQLETL
jgi:phosphate transport system substrate-binding protein